MRSGRGIVGCGVAAGLAAAATLLRMAIEPWLGVDVAAALFLPAIAAAALWWGTLPAVVCTAVGVVAMALWPRPVDLPQLALVAVGGTAILGLVGFHRSRDARRSDAAEGLREREAREREVQARVAELSEAISKRSAELVERDALMQAVVETAVDAILTIDEQGIVRSFNRAAERMFGFTAAEVLGQNVRVLMPSPYSEEHDAYLQRYLTSGVKRIIGIGRSIAGRRKDGTTFPAYLSVSEVRLGDRHLFTGFVRDLTEQRQLEQEFLRSQKMEAIANLSGAIAHDFNNILMGILACARVASSERHGDPALRESFDEIAAAANRGVALTRRLLAFGRRGPSVELRPTDIDAVVRANESMLRQLLGEDIALRVELAARGAALSADDGLIEQIVINLVVNARDAMPGGGQIAVTTRLEAGEIALEVRDTGTGIPEDVRPRIFEPFFTTKSAEKGTGLGLSTVKRIVEQLQGRIELQSALGKGTTFRLLFPRCSDAARLPDRAAAPAPSAAATAAVVLLVEDDRLVRASLVRFLKSRGHAVLVAADPAEALRLAEAQATIDVLVTDMVLPEITGNELAARLRATRPNLRVVFMSAHPAEMLIAQGRLREGDPYLEKPFEMDALAAVLNRLLADSRAARS